MPTASEMIAARDAERAAAEKVVTQPDPRGELPPRPSELIRANKIPAGWEEPGDPNPILSLGRGMVKRAGDLVDMAAQTAYDMSLAPGARRGEQVDFIPEAGEQLAQKTKIPAAQGSFGKMVETGGEWATDAVLMSPMVVQSAAHIGVKPTWAVLSELGFSVAGGMAAEAGEQEGSPLLMGGAMMAGAPATMTARGAQNLVAKTKRSVKEISKMTSPLRRYSGNMGVSAKGLIRSSEEWKRRVPDVPEFIKALKRGEAINRRVPGGVSTRQISQNMRNSRGGGFITAMDESVSKTSPEYGTQSARRRADLLDWLGNQWEKIGGDEAADYIEFLARYDEGVDVLKKAERAAWRTVRQGDQPTFDITSVQRYIRKEIDKLKLTDDIASVPNTFHDVIDPEKFGKEIDLIDFQSIRSNLLEIMREAKTNPTRQNRRAAQLSIPILNRMQRQIDRWSEIDEVGKSFEYLAAKDLTRSSKHLYDQDSPVIRVLEKGGIQKNLFTALRGAKGKRGNRLNPVTEAQRLVEIAEQTPDGLRNLQKMAIEDLFANTQGFTPTRVRMPLKTLTENSDAYRIVLGDKYDRAVDLLEISSLATLGKAGTSAQSMSVGSGVAPAQFLFGLAENAMSPVPGQGITQATIGAVKKIMKESSTNQIEQLRIFVAALEDPKYMRLLMEMPTEANLPAWVIGWKQLIKASASSTGRGAFRGAVNVDPDAINPRN